PRQSPTAPLDNRPRPFFLASVPPTSANLFRPLWRRSAVMLIGLLAESDKQIRQRRATESARRGAACTRETPSGLAKFGRAGVSSIPGGAALLGPSYEQLARRFLADPWAARDDYIDIIV